jgi:hypothetical protein
MCIWLLSSNGCGGQGAGADLFITLTDAQGREHPVNLAALEPISRQGGLIRSTGTRNGPARLTGPTLGSVLAIGGGLARGQAVRITAADGYSMVFTYDQAMGNIMTYDGTGHALTVGGTTPILAFDGDGARWAEGFPRLAFVGETAPLTDGHFWIRNIAEIAVVEDVHEWVLHLRGLVEYVMDRSTFESLATCPDSPHPAQRWEVEEEQGVLRNYDGVPLWVLISTIDGVEELAPHYRFNRALARQGYTVQVIGTAGDTMAFESMEAAYNDDLFLAYRVNDALLDAPSGPLMLTGSYLHPEARQVRQVTEIRLVNLPE